MKRTSTKGQNKWPQGTPYFQSVSERKVEQKIRIKGKERERKERSEPKREKFES